MRFPRIRDLKNGASPSLAFMEDLETKAKGTVNPGRANNVCAALPPPGPEAAQREKAAGVGVTN
jgi:hypothetical protein